MKLFYRKIGEGQPLIILHGLFGQSDNWNSHAKLLAENGLAVYLVDLRNHGNSPHSDVWNYKVMSEDVFELVNDLGLANNNSVIILGHSMGGKVAMQFAIDHGSLLKKLIVVDISPAYHHPDNEAVLKALTAIDLKQMKTRKEVEAVLSEYISDIGTKQFLLKNSYWVNDKDSSDNKGSLAWRFNRDVILQEIKNVSEEIQFTSPCNVPTLFISGSLSNYIKNNDIILIKKLFTDVTFVSIYQAGHWVHADKPKEFSESVLSFVK